MSRAITPPSTKKIRPVTMNLRPTLLWLTIVSHPHRPEGLLHASARVSVSRLVCARSVISLRFAVSVQLAQEIEDVGEIAGIEVDVGHPVTRFHPLGVDDPAAERFPRVG